MVGRSCRKGRSASREPVVLLRSAHGYGRGRLACVTWADTMFRNIPTPLYSDRLTNCVECGGTMKRTGNGKASRSSRPAFNCYVAPSVWLVEYTCESCGRQEWAEAGVVED